LFIDAGWHIPQVTKRYQYQVLLRGEISLFLPQCTEFFNETECNKGGQSQQGWLEDDKQQDILHRSL
jgi:hypothetical protein